MKMKSKGKDVEEPKNAELGISSRKLLNGGNTTQEQVIKIYNIKNILLKRQQKK